MGARGPVGVPRTASSSAWRRASTSGFCERKVPGPGEAVGDGFVAGEEDGEDFVTHLGVGHGFELAGGLAFGVEDFGLGAEEHGEEVAAVLEAGVHGGALFVNEAVDDLIERGLGAAEAGDAGDGEVEEALDGGEGDDEVVEVHDGVDFVVDAKDVGGDLGVEEGAGDDFEREAHGGGGDVEGGVGGDVAGGGEGGGDDLVGVGGDALAVEGGGGDAALAHVEGLIGGDEAFAEEDLHAADGALLDEGGGLGDEDFADVVGVVDEDDGSAEELVVADVAVGAVEVLEEEDGAAELDPGLEGVEG